MGIGIVARDDTGKVWAYSCLSHPFFSSSTVVECWALLRALIFYVELSLSSMGLEGDDAKVIINALKIPLVMIDLPIIKSISLNFF